MPEYYNAKFGGVWTTTRGETQRGGGGGGAREHLVPPSLYFTKIAHLDRVNHIMVVFICLQKYDYANLNHFPQILLWPVKPLKYICTKFEVIWTIENRVMDQRSSRIFYWASEHSFAHEHAGPSNTNVKKFSELQTAVTLASIRISTTKMQIYFKIGQLALCKNLFGKKSFIIF